MRAGSKTGIIPDVQAPEDDQRQDLAVNRSMTKRIDAAKYKQFQEEIDKIQLDKALEILSKDRAPAKKAA